MVEKLLFGQRVVATAVLGTAEYPTSKEAQTEAKRVAKLLGWELVWWRRAKG